MRWLWDLPLSWLLLPLKVVIIISMWFVTQCRNFYYKKNPRYFGKDVQPNRNFIDKYEDLLSHSPIFKSYGMRLYAMGIKPGEKITGMNHNWDHSASRHGVWVSIEKKMGVHDPDEAVRALERHWTGLELRRGYRIEGDRVTKYSDQDVSGDMLCGFCFGFIHYPEKIARTMIEIGHHLVNNKGLKTNGVVSPRANFAPGYQKSETPVPVGAQNLTYLAGIKAAIYACKYFPASELKLMGYSKFKLQWEYYTRMFLYMDFLTIMFPSASVWTRRGYFNENNCMMAAYVGHQTSSGVERLIYKFSLMFTWSHSWAWLNGFYSGILQSATGILSDKYMNRCRKYAEDFCGMYVEQGFYSQEQSAPAKYYPNDPETKGFGEFLPEDGHDYERFNGKFGFRSTVGQLAYLVWTK